MYPLCASSYYCVEVTSGSSANNAVVQIGYDSSSTPPIRQRFRVQPNSDGSFSFLSRVSNYSKAIVVYNASTSDGAAIIQYTANGTANSKWFIEDVDDVDAGRRAYLVGVEDESPHDHLTSLNAASPTIRNLGYAPSIEYGEFTYSNINYYLENSRIFLIRCHGEAYSGGTRLVIDNDDSNPAYYTSSSSMSSLDLSNLELAIFLSCHTGKGGENAPNLPSVAVERGATTAIGFTDAIPCGASGEWMKAFFDKMQEGYTVQQACDQLQGDGEFINTPLATPVICGNKNLRLN